MFLGRLVEAVQALSCPISIITTLCRRPRELIRLVRSLLTVVAMWLQPTVPAVRLSLICLPTFPLTTLRCVLLRPTIQHVAIQKIFKCASEPCKTCAALSNHHFPTAPSGSKRVIPKVASVLTPIDQPPEKLRRKLERFDSEQAFNEYMLNDLPSGSGAVHVISPTQHITWGSRWSA